MKEVGILEHSKKAMLVVQAILKYNVIYKKKSMSKEEKLNHLNIIRDRIKDF